MRNFFAFASLAFSLASYIPYWTHNLNEAKKPPGARHLPQKATWIIWALVDLIVAMAMTLQGVIALQMWAYVVGAGSIAIWSYFHGEDEWTLDDKIVLALATLAMALWPFTNGNVATGISLVAVMVGSWPMWKDLWNDPDSVPRLPWWLFWIGGLAGVLAIGPVEDWTYASALGPVGFFVLQTNMILLGLPIRKKRVTA